VAGDQHAVPDVPRLARAGVRPARAHTKTGCGYDIRKRGTPAYSGMNTSVLCEVVFPREGLAACVTVMRLLSCMRAHVSDEVAGRREGLAACIAAMRLLSCMRPHASDEVAGRREGLAAFVAAMRLLSCMRPHVSDEVAGRREGLAAFVAAMRLLSCMRPHVSDEVAGRREGLAGSRVQHRRLRHPTSKFACVPFMMKAGLREESSARLPTQARRHQDSHDEDSDNGSNKT
jgi:hypothetical protein